MPDLMGFPPDGQARRQGPVGLELDGLEDAPATRRRAAFKTRRHDEADTH